MSTIEHLNSWSDAWADAMWAVVWQSAILACLVAIAVGALRRSAPQLRYWLWQIVAIKLLLMPFWMLALPLPVWLDGGRAASATTPNQQVASTPMPPSSEPTRAATRSQPDGKSIQPAASLSLDVAHLNWKTWLFVVWAVGVGGNVARLILQHIRLSRLLRQTSTASERVTKSVSEAAGTLKLRRPPNVLSIETECSPFVCGVLRSKLVLSQRLTETLDETQLRQVVLHELAHVKRRDLVWGWIPEIARIAYFFHPVAHVAYSRIRLERELACDHLAISLSGRSAQDYADMLVHVIRDAIRPALLRTVPATDASNTERSASRHS